MRTLLIVLFCFYSNSVFAKNTKKQAHGLNSPELGLRVLDATRSQWTVMKVLSKHISFHDYKFLKFKGDQLGVHYKRKTPIRIAKNRWFYVQGISQPMRFDSSGKVLIFNKRKIKLNKAKGLRYNYNRIQKFLNEPNKKFSIWSFLLPQAHAENVNRANAFHLAVLMYYMDVHSDAGGELMEDFFMEEPAVRKALSHLHQNGIQVNKIGCDNLGMFFHYDNGAKAYLTKADDGKTFRLNEQRTSDGAEKEHFAGSGDQSLMQLGHHVFCNKYKDDQREKFVSKVNVQIEKYPELVKGVAQ